MTFTTSAAQFSWDTLVRYKVDGRWLDGVSADYRTFWAPRDDIHGLLRDLLTSAQHSVVLNMYGFDDTELDNIIRGHATTDHVFVQMSLDKSQAGGIAEKTILQNWNNQAIGTSIAIGTSSQHAISHLKVLIVDGVYTVSGSTTGVWAASRGRTMS
jgi:hypothetical protein